MQSLFLLIASHSRMPILLGMVLLASCDKIDNNPLPSGATVYRKDLWVNGIEGIGVLPFQNQYVVQVESRDKMELLRFTTCHRAQYAERSFNIIQKPIISWFGFPRKITKDREFEFIYKPVWEEIKGDCIMYLEAIAGNGIVSSGMYIPDDKSYTLKGSIACNSNTFRGEYSVFACQSLHGTEQTLAFDTVVEVSPKNTCGLSGKSKTWSIVQPLGECSAVFKDGSGSMAVYYGWAYNKEYVRL